MIGKNWLLYPSLVRTKKEYEDRFEAIQLSVLAFHIEIMKQCLWEQIQSLKFESNSYLDELCFFLKDLRNAFKHTTGELVPRWDKKLKTKSIFT